jgi:hypothetical protein
MTSLNLGKTNSSSAPQEPKQASDYQITWYEAGNDNPYGVEILDIRGFTQNAVATKYHQTVVDSFNEGRANDGAEYETAFIKNSQTYSANLSYPYKGLVLNGIIYKAGAMEIKWDIYAYNDWLYFVKSWTGELMYKAHFLKRTYTFVIDEIVTGAVERMSSTDEEKETYAAQNIHSMIKTHIFDEAWPYKIPEMMRGIPEEHIAAHMFALFGSKATIATHANVLEIEFKEQ